MAAFGAITDCVRDLDQVACASLGFTDQPQGWWRLPARIDAEALSAVMTRWCAPE